MRIFLALVLIIMLMENAVAQPSTFEIRGKVLDEKNRPIEFVSVYINSTSIFTHTDSLGRFTLVLPNSKVDFELVVSMVGFKTQKQKFSKSNIPKFLSIKMFSSELGEVVIKAKQDRYWWKKWQIFRNGLLGENQFSRECAIENREFIHLKMDSTNKLVLAHSSETFVVVNRALGYKIHVDLFEFKSDGVKTDYSALKYFEDDLSVDEKKRAAQLKKRQKAFDATSNSFLHSLANGSTTDEKFEVFKVKSMVDVYLGKTTVNQEILEGRLIKTSVSDIYAYDTLNKRHIIHSVLPLLVFNKSVLNYFRNPFTDYTYAFSKIDLPKQFAAFTDNGFISIPNGITFHYHWGNEGLASALPENYEVPEVQTPEPLIELVFENTLTDSTTVGTPNKSDQTIGYVKSAPISENDDYMMNADYTYRPTELEKNMDIYTLLKRLPGLKVTLNLETGQYDVSMTGSKGTPALLIDKKIYAGQVDVTNALDYVETNRISEIGLVKHGGNAILGSRGGSGTIIIKFMK